MAVTHLAGNQIIIGHYAIQRCLLCGEILDEFDVRNLAVPTEQDRGIPCYTVGGLYERDGNRTSLVRLTESTYFETDLDLPDNCCIRQGKK